jgi:hypothetical protein
MGADSIFISYSHDSPEHSDRVLALSDTLRQLGVDAELDQYHTRPPICRPSQSLKKLICGRKSACLGRYRFSWCSYSDLGFDDDSNPLKTLL